MKLTSIALAIAFALPSTLAFAEGPMNLADSAARPVVRGVAIGSTAGPIATKPPNISGNTLAPRRPTPPYRKSISSLRKGIQS
jgi:hypothetical protein